MLSPNELHTYVSAFALKSEVGGNGTKYPTLRDCAQKFRVTQREIEEICSEGVRGGYLGIGVALGSSGGVSDLLTGQRVVEAG